MTNRQKQNLLQYLGYYEGRPDGIWGDLSRRATEAFQRGYLPPASVDGIFGPVTEARILEVIVSGEHFQTQTPADVPDNGTEDSANENTDTDNKTGTFWDGIKYFKRSEFACKCGKYCNGYPVEPAEATVRAVDEIRRRLGVPVTVTSGIRCKQHNANEGGVYNSQHLYGTAADLHSSASPQRMKEVAEAVLGDTGGIGYYSWGIHVDVGKYSRWTG